MLISTWFIPIIAYTILRYNNIKRYALFNGKRYTFFDILFDSYRLTILGTSQFCRQNKVDRVLMIFLSIFSLLANILFSGLLFQLYTSDFSYQEIDSIEDLARSDLEVHYPVDNMDKESEIWLKNK